MPRTFASIGGREWRRGVKGQIGSRFASNRPAFCVKSSAVLRQNAPRFASKRPLVLRQITPSFCVKSPPRALGICPIKDHVRRVTVIDRHGQDLNVRLFGEVTQEGDFFRSDCNTAQPIYWDSVSGTYSYEKPYTEEVGGQQLISTIDGNWMLHRGRGRVSPRFLDNELLFKSDGIMVEREGGYGFQLVKANGRMGTCYKRIPAEVRMVPDVRSLGLIRKQKE